MPEQAIELPTFCVLATVQLYGFNEQKTAAGRILSAVFVRVLMHRRLNCYINYKRYSARIYHSSSAAAIFS